MAENKGKTKGAIMGAVQSAQMAVGSALKGGQMAMGGSDGASSQSVPLLEDLREIGKENEQNTQSMLSIFKAMFIFDKEQAAKTAAAKQRREEFKRNQRAPKAFNLDDLDGFDTLKWSDELKIQTFFTTMAEHIADLASPGDAEYE